MKSAFSKFFFYNMVVQTHNLSKKNTYIVHVFGSVNFGFFHYVKGEGFVCVSLVYVCTSIDSSVCGSPWKSRRLDSGESYRYWIPTHRQHHDEIPHQHSSSLKWCVCVWICDILRTLAQRNRQERSYLERSFARSLVNYGTARYGAPHRHVQ